MTTYTTADYSIPNPASFSRERISNAAMMRSPLTGSIQTAERAGARWRLRCEWVVKGADREQLEALLTRLNGPEHRIALPMYDFASGKAVRGAWSGFATTVVDGAGQSGYSINVRGATASVTDFALPGDVFRYDNGVKMVTAPVDTDISGNATIPIWPPIRTAPADGTAILLNTVGVYFLAELSEIGVSDELASGEYLSRIGAIFEEDVLA